jgi:hypothetical protein
MSDAQILGNPSQLRSTLWLMQHLQIKLAKRDRPQREPGEPYHYELIAALRCQTHANWPRADMEVYRRRL